MIEGNLKRGDRSANTVGMRRHIDRQCVMTDDRYTLMHIENMGERQRETGKIKGIDRVRETDREKNSQIEKKKGSAVLYMYKYVYYLTSTTVYNYRKTRKELPTISTSQ